MTLKNHQTKKLYQIQMKQLIKLLVFLSFTTIFGQQNTTAELELATTKGLHKIKLPHTLRSFANKDLRDLRIWDTTNNQVPYFIIKANTKIQASDFREFKIVDKSKIVDTSATYIFKNEEKQLNQVVLHVANFKGNKRYNVLGSHDLKSWFGLTSNQYLSNLNNTQNTSTYKVIHFPLCTYKYLKIVFNDKNSLPINVLNIGKSIRQINGVTTEKIPAEKIKYSKLVEQQKTKISIAFSNPEIIDKIAFNIDGPDFFRRSAVLYYLTTREKNHKEITEKQIIKRFTLNSERLNSFEITNFFGKELFIEINNQDNPELKISKLEFSQNSLYAIADLKANEKYTVSVGDKKLRRPNYDISYFKNKVSEKLPILAIKNINHKNNITVKKERSFWQQPWFMWLCIGVATLFIGYVISGLVKDIKHEDA